MTKRQVNQNANLLTNQDNGSDISTDTSSLFQSQSHSTGVKDQQIC